MVLSVTPLSPTKKNHDQKLYDGAERLLLHPAYIYPTVETNAKPSSCCGDQDPGTRLGFSFTSSRHFTVTNNVFPVISRPNIPPFAFLCSRRSPVSLSLFPPAATRRVAFPSGQEYISRQNKMTAPSGEEIHFLARQFTARSCQEKEQKKYPPSKQYRPFLSRHHFPFCPRFPPKKIHFALKCHRFRSIYTYKYIYKYMYIYIYIPGIYIC